MVFMLGGVGRRWWVIGYVVVCFVCMYVYGCCRCPWRACLGVRLRGGLLVVVRGFWVADVGELGCDLVVLLVVDGISVMYVGWCVFGDVMSPVVSLACVGLKATHGRLRLLVCVVCV